MRTTIISLESQANDAIVQNAIQTTFMDENVHGNNLLKLNEQAGEFDNLQSSTSEAFEVTEALEGMATVLTGAKLSRHDANVIHFAVEHLCKKIGYASIKMPAMENYGGIMSREEGTKVALEFIKETAIAIWEAIKAAFRKMGEWISAFWNWITTSNDKQKEQFKVEQNKLDHFKTKVAKTNTDVVQAKKKEVTDATIVHQKADTHEQLISKMEAVYDHDKKIVLPDSTHSKYLNCDDIEYSMELFMTNTRHTCDMLKEIGIFLKSGKDLIQKDHASRKKLYNEINGLFTDTNNLNSIKFHPSELKEFDVEGKGKHIMFPFNKLLLTVVDDKEIVSNADHAELNRMDASLFRFSKIMTSIYRPDHEIKTHVPLNAITSDLAEKIFKHCTETLEALESVDHEASINKGLTAFNNAVANIKGHDDAATRQYAKWVQRTYQALLSIISDIAKYIKTTCHHVIAWAQQSMAVREADLKKWEYDTTIVI